MSFHHMNSIIAQLERLQRINKYPPSSLIDCVEDASLLIIPSPDFP